MAAAPWRIIITRPETQAAVWAQQLQTAGFVTARINLLNICAVTEPTQIRAIKNSILNLDLYQKIIFVSQNAVEFGMQWIEDYWPQIPIKIDFFAVGGTTAKKLAAYGVRVQDLATCANGGMTSEDLLQAPSLLEIAGEKILIFRGLGGRGHLAEHLRTRGALVDYCELYYRELPKMAGTQLLQLITDAAGWAQQENIITLHSGESLENLMRVIQQISEPSQVQTHALTLLRNTLVLVPSARIAEAAKAAGFNRILVAENATDTAMTAALLNYYRNNCTH